MNVTVANHPIPTSGSYESYDIAIHENSDDWRKQLHASPEEPISLRKEPDADESESNYRMFFADALREPTGSFGWKDRNRNSHIARDFRWIAYRTFAIDSFWKDRCRSGGSIIFYFHRILQWFESEERGWHYRHWLNSYVYRYPGPRRGGFGSRALVGKGSRFCFWR